MPLNETLLRDPARPVSRIAERLLPYLRVLVERFHPQQIILFGSYAYGTPDEDSDVDLLVVKEIEKSSVKDGVAIRQAWEPLIQDGRMLDIQMVIESPERHQQRIACPASFYAGIVTRGLSVL